MDKACHKILEFCMKQAAKDSLSYCWVDRCYINKTKLTELSKAISSITAVGYSVVLADSIVAKDGTTFSKPRRVILASYLWMPCVLTHEISRYLPVQEYVDARTTWYPETTSNRRYQYLPSGRKSFR